VFTNVVRLRVHTVFAYSNTGDYSILLIRRSVRVSLTNKGLFGVTILQSLASYKPWLWNHGWKNLIPYVGNSQKFGAGCCKPWFVNSRLPNSPIVTNHGLDQNHGLPSQNCHAKQPLIRGPSSSTAAAARPLEKWNTTGTTNCAKSLGSYSQACSDIDASNEKNRVSRCRSFSPFLELFLPN